MKCDTTTRIEYNFTHDELKTLLISKAGLEQIDPNKIQISYPVASITVGYAPMFACTLSLTERIKG